MEPLHAPPQLLYTLVFSEIGRRGLRDASQMLGSYINNRKRAIDLSFAELATILFPFLFCLLSLANGILILFDKRFSSMRFPLHEPRLMFRCFVVAGIHVAFGPNNQNIPQHLCIVLNVCLSLPCFLAVNQQQFVNPRFALFSVLMLVAGVANACCINTLLKLNFV